MKKLLPALLCLIAPIAIKAQVTTSTSQYSAEQLVNTILLGNNVCDPATNITSVTGTNFGSVNGIGYFESNNSGFPFESGVILSTGGAANAGGPVTGSNEGNNEWIGDGQLNDYMNGLGYDLQSANASKLEFDFTAGNSSISLDYIFASNEYGMYQCNFSDAVAILLTDLTNGSTSVNMAVVPNTTEPVSTVSIRNSMYNSSCNSVNPQYFAAFYQNDPLAPINFRGATVPLTAQATTVPGHNYHLKIVIADRTDSSFDSAVFIEAGSFTIGNINMSDLAITSSHGEILCDGSLTELSVTQNSEYLYQWYKDGVALGNTTNTLNVTEPGEYSVTVSLADTSCAVQLTTLIISGGSVMSGLTIDDLTAYEEDTDGISTFDLSSVADALTEQFPDNELYTITFHQTLADAQFSANQLPLIFVGSDGQVLYARIENMNGCFVTISFTLAISETVPPPVAVPTQTFTEGATLADIEIDGENIQWYATQSGETPLSISTLMVNNTTYYATQNINGIESVQRTAVTVSTLAGVNDTPFAGFQYFPNPVRDVLTIKNMGNIDIISVYNAIGQRVNSIIAIGTVASVDVFSSLTAGVYLIEIGSEGKTKTIKIIKD